MKHGLIECPACHENFDPESHPDGPCACGADVTAAQTEALRELGDAIDQLSAAAAEPRQTKRLLDLAWWFVERAIRARTGRCSGGCEAHMRRHERNRYCACCHHYEELETLARRVGVII